MNLTPQQRTAVNLIAGGHTYAEAAQVMGIALPTFKEHTRRAYDRLGARNPAHAVHLAHQAGLIGGKP